MYPCFFLIHKLMGEHTEVVWFANTHTPTHTLRVCAPKLIWSSWAWVWFQDSPRITQSGSLHTFCQHGVTLFWKCVCVYIMLCVCVCTYVCYGRASFDGNRSECVVCVCERQKLWGVQGACRARCRELRSLPASHSAAVASGDKCKHIYTQTYFLNLIHTPYWHTYIISHWPHLIIIVLVQASHFSLWLMGVKCLLLLELYPAVYANWKNFLSNFRQMCTRGIHTEFSSSLYSGTYLSTSSIVGSHLALN